MYIVTTTADTENDYISFSLTPYYRFYFGKKPATGFFFEGFGMYNAAQTSDYYSTNYNNGYFNSTIKGEKISDFALGFGLGGKWMTRKGIVFELSGGVGRSLLNEKNNTIGTKIVDRGALSVGYRF